MFLYVTCIVCCLLIMFVVSLCVSDVMSFLCVSSFILFERQGDAEREGGVGQPAGGRGEVLDLSAS